MKERTEKVRSKIKIDGETVQVALLGLLIVGIVSGTGVAIVSGIEAEKNRYFKYSVNESGEYIADGTIKFEELKKCYFVEIENPSCQSREFYICRKSSSDSSRYINLLNNEEFFVGKTFDKLKDKNSERSIVNEESLEQYLYGFEQVKAEYTPDDVKNILEQIKKSFSEKEDKVLVKSTFNKYFTKVTL